ncbi:MAG: hypothetical protein IPK57_06300 [Chitinophagaceae bacterium]|nr:hypothetical protein [Chitinophagaceae bacterium]
MKKLFLSVALFSMTFSSCDIYLNSQPVQALLKQKQARVLKKLSGRDW